MAIVDCKNGIKRLFKRIDFLVRTKRGKRSLRLNHTARKFHEWVPLQMLELKQSVLPPMGYAGERNMLLSQIANYTRKPSFRNPCCKAPWNKVAAGKPPDNVTQTDDASGFSGPCARWRQLQPGFGGESGESLTFFMIQSLICP